MLADTAVPAEFEPKLNDPAWVVEGPAAFVMKVNGAAEVVFAASVVFPALKPNGEGAKLVVLTACDEIVVAEVEAVPN